MKRIFSGTKYFQCQLIFKTEKKSLVALNIFSGGLWHRYVMSLWERWASMAFLFQVLQAGSIQPLLVVAVLCELLQHIHDLSLVNVRGGLSFCEHKENRFDDDRWLRSNERTVGSSSHRTLSNFGNSWENKTQKGDFCCLHRIFYSWREKKTPLERFYLFHIVVRRKNNSFPRASTASLQNILDSWFHGIIWSF